MAASPEQIREVLSKDPGLLVELKRLVAREATANGQLIDDTDLTDQAIFDRLGEDVVFRSEATRLVQRYGYLLPSINPNSELGKQEELVLKERARRLVQIEAQEDAESMKPEPKEDASQATQQTSTCDSARDSECTESVPHRFWRNGEREDAPAPSRICRVHRTNLPPRHLFHRFLELA